MDTTTLEIEHKSQRYIKPESTAVTQFCTNLTYGTADSFVTLRCGTSTDVHHVLRCWHIRPAVASRRFAHVSALLGV